MGDSLDHHWSEPRVAAFFRAHPDRVPRTPSFVPAGWDKPVADALTSLLDIERASGMAVRITQIKEGELGGLRIYVDVDESSAGPLEVVKSTPASPHLRNSVTPGSVQERVHAIVDQAAARADFRCIRCGRPITHRDRLYRVCAAHRQRMPSEWGS
jgi:hypothetical protein